MIPAEPSSKPAAAEIPSASPGAPFLTPQYAARGGSYLSVMSRHPPETSLPQGEAQSENTTGLQGVPKVRTSWSARHSHTSETTLLLGEFNNNNNNNNNKAP
jgi:hypothetical protein